MRCHWMNAKECYEIVTQNRSRSVLPERLWAKRSLFEISSVFIPSVMCVTWCNLTYSQECNIFAWNLYNWLGRSLPVWLVLLLLQIVSYFTCVWSFTLLLFTLSWTGHTNLRVKTIVNVIWLVDSHLYIFTPFSCGLFSCIFMMFTIISSRGDCYDESFWLLLYPVKCLFGYWNIYEFVD